MPISQDAAGLAQKSACAKEEPLCEQPAPDFAQALTCARQYTSRWLIEDSHKALQTGIGAGKPQLQTAARLFAAVARLSVVAQALVDLREQSRWAPNAPTCA